MDWTFSNGTDQSIPSNQFNSSPGDGHQRRPCDPGTFRFNQFPDTGFGS